MRWGGVGYSISLFFPLAPIPFTNSNKIMFSCILKQIEKKIIDAISSRFICALNWPKFWYNTSFVSLFQIQNLVRLQKARVILVPIVLLLWAPQKTGVKRSKMRLKRNHHHPKVTWKKKYLPKLTKRNQVIKKRIIKEDTKKLILSMFKNQIKK